MWQRRHPNFDDGKWIDCTKEDAEKFGPGGVYGGWEVRDLPSKPQPASQFVVTDEMHVAAVKVLRRASGLDGLPQRMVDAMLSAAKNDRETKSMDCSGGPRVRTVCQDKLSGTYRYKGHDIEIDYDQRHDGWYIVVRAPNGIRDYDGWWRNSSGKTHREAVLEALRGSMLWPNTELKDGHD